MSWLFLFRERRNDLWERNQRKSGQNSRRRIPSPRANMARSRKPARRRIPPLPAACVLRKGTRRRRTGPPRASMARSPPGSSGRIRSGPAPPTICGGRKMRTETEGRNPMTKRPGLTGPVRNVLMVRNMPMGRNGLTARNALTAGNRTRRRRHRKKRIRPGGNWNRPGKSWPHRSRPNSRDWQRRLSGVCGRRYGFTPTTKYTRLSMRT